MKNMRTLQKRIAYQLQQGSLDAEVTGITCDSRKVQPQNVFVCIRGNRMDGHVYAEEAVERGAAVLVGSALIPEKATRDTAGINMVTLKKNARIAKVRLAAGLELKDPHRYRVRTLPAAGALLRQEDTTEQMSL